MQQAGIGVLGIAIASGIYWLVKKVKGPAEDNNPKNRSPKRKRRDNEQKK